jgi:hypothetical protein
MSDYLVMSRIITINGGASAEQLSIGQKLLVDLKSTLETQGLEVHIMHGHQLQFLKEMNPENQGPI